MTYNCQARLLKIVQNLVVALICLLGVITIYWSIARGIESAAGQFVLCSWLQQCFTLPFLGEITKFAGYIYVGGFGSIFVFAMLSYHFLLPAVDKENQEKSTPSIFSPGSAPYDPYDIWGNIRHILGLTGKNGELQIWKYKMVGIVLLTLAIIIVFEQLRMHLTEF